MSQVEYGRDRVTVHYTIDGAKEQLWVGLGLCPEAGLLKKQ